MTTVRSSAAVLTATAVLCVTLAPAAVAGGDVPAGPPSAAPSANSPSHGTGASSANSPSLGAPAPTPSPAPPASVVIPPGLYGTTDPTYDGVWRQSLAMLGQFAAGVRPADRAVTWLKGQQCANGAFPSYRADPGTPCDAGTTLDSQATAAAVQALSTIGHQRPAMRKALNWLTSTQNTDGGWSRSPGAPSDAQSTSLVIGALTAAGVRPSSVKSSAHQSPYDALAGFSIPCDVTAGGGVRTAGGGAFAYQPDAKGKLTANAEATTAGVLAGIGKRMVVSPVRPGPAPACQKSLSPAPERAARNGAAYLAAALAETGHLDRTPAPGTAPDAPQPDPGSTADAVTALSAAGYGREASGALEWLKRNSAAWAQQNGPAAYARLILACHATDTDPRNFGGIDLVQRLNATGPTPKAKASKTSTELTATTASASSDGGGGMGGIWWIVALALAAGIGLGGRSLLNGVRKAPQL
ncbi:prenyltransferase/squalene oxidase repeat-containing protein [Streptomyces sp. NPDC088725]|uniref:prenyltransferase/squalene oxidase repeat-containing protein n=1 Tax=Streptomyces sp. NPDC088725 TaxID=3365873 RepID=UPI003818DFD4